MESVSRNWDMNLFLVKAQGVYPVVLLDEELALPGFDLILAAVFAYDIR
jgi:hypothetical protein